MNNRRIRTCVSASLFLAVLHLHSISTDTQHAPPQSPLSLSVPCVQHGRAMFTNDHQEFHCIDRRVYESQSRGFPRVSVVSRGT